MDRRVRKTRESLKNALIELLNEKDFEAVTVHDITDKADVNRGTFYHHYYDKYDLLEKTIEEMSEKLKESVVASGEQQYQFEIAPLHDGEFSSKGDVTSEPFVRLFKHILEEKRFYERMFSAKVFHYFYPRFIEVLHSYFEKAFDERITGDEVKVDRELFINYILFAYLGVLRYWIQEGMRKSPEYMGEQIKVLLTMTPFEFRELPKG